MENIVLIKHCKNWGLSEDMVREKALLALKHWGYIKDIELSLIFVGEKKAKETNIAYRGKNYIPQVLGFPLSRKPDDDGMIRLGDVMICTKKLKYECKFQNEPLEKTLMDWMIHGVENLIK